MSGTSNDREIERFIGIYADALREENAAVFAGAGLSIPAGLVDWKTLLRDIARDVGLDVDRETDLLSVAQFHVNERNRHRINQALVTEFAERSQSTENHAILASLPIRTYWTTNYDTLIEDALRAHGKRPDVKRTEGMLAKTLPQRDAVVYKMHGDVSDVDAAIVTKDDYEGYSAKHQLFGTALQGDLVSKTFLFIGFSFNDPNLNYILSRIRLLLGANTRDHYCLLRRVQPADFSDRSDYDYARARQELQVRDLRRYGIHGLLVDSYAEYAHVLKRIASRFYRRRVFVSGSAETYAPWSDGEAQELLRAIGLGLIAADLDVVTGFGKGVGAYLLNGALEGLAASGSHSLHDRVTLRPFPQGISDATERARRWRTYREDMLASAGIAVFLFGNRAGKDNLELAEGMEEEFELATELGLIIVPVGCTGYMSQRLHERLMSDYAKLSSGGTPWRSQIEALATTGAPHTLAKRVIELVSSIAKGQ